MPDPILTLATGTRHRRESLIRFIDSAVKAATVPTKILIADASDEFINGDLAGVREAKDATVTIEIYHEHPRTNVNLGYDRLCRESTTEFVTFFNDDCSLVPGWDRIALDFMKAHSEVGIGCLYWTDPGGSWYVQTWSGVIYPNFGIIRKSAGDAFGWFETRSVYIAELEREEALSFYGMDCGIALKCVDAGFACVPIPGTRVIHHREQDAERAENFRKHQHDDRRMPPGSLPGTILTRLWNGNDPSKPGDAMLREKAKRFAYLGYEIYDK